MAMAFLVLLITLAGYMYFGWHFQSRHDVWFDRLTKGFRGWFADQPRLVMLASLLVPIMIAGWVLWLTQHWLFGLLGLVLQVVILSYALGRNNLSEQLKSYLQHWRAGDIQSAYHHAGEHFKCEDGFSADNPTAMHRSVSMGLLYQWFEQVFVVLFWYLVAGPLAALFVRLLCLLNAEAKDQDQDQEGPLHLLHVLEWVPVRFLNLTFAIAGNFVHSFRTLLRAMGSLHTPTENILYDSAVAATGIHEADHEAGTPDQSKITEMGDELQALHDLVQRSLVVWLVIVAILVVVSP